MRDPELTGAFLPSGAAQPAMTEPSRPGELRPLRLLYLLYFGGLGFLIPFLNLIFLRGGLTGVQIGWLGTVTAVCSLASAPLWGRWSDRALEPKRLIQLGLLGAAACLVWLRFQQGFVWTAVAIGV